MFKNIVPVNKDAHENKKLREINSFSFASEFNLATVMVHEFSRAASVYPIIFVENQETGDFKSVALLGFELGSNLFVNEDGEWDASYIPAIVRRYPFALAKTNEDQRFTVCIDEKSEFLSDDEGEPLFEEDGKPSEVMERIKRYLGELHQMEQITNQFCKAMKEKYMLTPLSMKFRDTDTVKNISGAYVINEERLNNLSDDDFLSLRHDNHLQPIYSHMSSLGQFDRLNKLRIKTNE